MPIDSQIPLQAKPMQLDNPLASYANVMAIQGAMSQNKLHDLQYRKMERDMADQDSIKNSLIGAGGDPQKMIKVLMDGGHADKAFALQKQIFESRLQGAKLSKEELAIAEQKAEAISAALAPHVDDPTFNHDKAERIGSLLESQGRLDKNWRASIPANPADLNNWLKTTVFSTKAGLAAVKELAQKLQAVPAGGVTKIMDMNSLSRTAGQQVGAPIAHVATPGEAMRAPLIQAQTNQALAQTGEIGNQNWVVNADRGFTANRLTGETRPLTISGTNVGAKQRDTKPGERIAPDGTIEVIPGSAEWTRRQNLHANDYGALTAVDAKTDNAIRKLDYILDEKNKGAFNSNFGGYNAYITERLPGETQNVRNAIEALKSDLKSAGLELMRAGGSIGQMTEREWPIVERAISNIDPRLSEEKAREELGAVRNYLDKIRRNAKEKYDTEWESQRQFYKGSRDGNGAVGAKTITRAQAQALATQTETSVDEVLNAAKAKGYTVK